MYTYTARSTIIQIHILQGVCCNTSWPGTKENTINISNKQPFFVFFVSAGVVGEAIFKKIPQGVIIDPAGTNLSFTAFEDHGPLPEWSLGAQMAGEVWKLELINRGWNFGATWTWTPAYIVFSSAVFDNLLSLL